ncbi:hypothetical protein DWY54_00715 [Parabacteroides distasonis]|nr:hypothetical protein DW215_18985 [Parabacteroides sp. AM18-12LB]RGR36675.1 hypothetical protein DWY54_00715 [Parabacteroides distasonis]RGZ61210.1 hypothetical protein DW984_03565 [Parabacteroides distasonis]RHK73569.1 hypothetical protein DW048_12045 [Phocaeicola vulgatus]
MLEGLNKKVKGVMYTRNALVLFRLGCIKEAKYFISGFFPPTFWLVEADYHSVDTSSERCKQLVS